MQIVAAHLKRRWSSVRRASHRCEHAVVLALRSGSLPASGWESELEYGAPRHVGRGPQSPAVGLNDRLADRKPHSHAVGLGGVKGIEQTIRGGLIEASSGIDHRHEDIAWSIP